MQLQCTNHPEEWRSVVGWEGLYEVSSCGRLRSTYPNRPVRMLNPWADQFGYMTCTLGALSKKALHRLVCEAFHGGQKPSEITVNHKDGVKANNHATNVEWATKAENNRHARAMDLQRNGKKLTEGDVRAIRDARRRGIPTRELARRYGVDTSTIYGVVRRRVYDHVLP